MNIRVQILKKQTLNKKYTDEQEKDGVMTQEKEIILSPTLNITDLEYFSDRDQTVRELGSYDNKKVIDNYIHVLDQIDNKRFIDLLQRLDLSEDDVKQNLKTNDHYETYLQKLTKETQYKLEKGIPKAESYDTIPSYFTIRKLGSGVFANAFLIVKNDENSKFVLEANFTLPKNHKILYVLKRIEYPVKRDDFVEDQLLETLRIEKGLGYCLSHPNILKFYGCYRDNSFVTMITEYVPCGTVHSIWNIDPYNHFITDLYKKRMKYISAQVILALEYLHGLEMIHSDVNMNNLCIDHKGYVKLIDFGLAKLKNGKVLRQAGVCKCLLLTIFFF
jgi:hypothetical protein